MKHLRAGVRELPPDTGCAMSTPRRTAEPGARRAFRHHRNGRW